MLACATCFLILFDVVVFLFLDAVFIALGIAEHSDFTIIAMIKLSLDEASSCITSILCWFIPERNGGCTLFALFSSHRSRIVPMGLPWEQSATMIYNVDHREKQGLWSQPCDTEETMYCNVARAVHNAMPCHRSGYEKHYIHTPATQTYWKKRDAVKKKESTGWKQKYSQK